MEETQDPPLTPQQFSAKIKAKYPEYKDVDDIVLAKKIIEKYPEYAKKVSFGEVKKKVSSVSTPQEAAGVSPTRTTTPGTSSDTEPPTRAQASGGLGGQTGNPFQSIDLLADQETPHHHVGGLSCLTEPNSPAHSPKHSMNVP